MKIWAECGIIIDMEKIKAQLAEVIKRLFGADLEPEVTVAPEDTGADFASNAAMRLAKVLHKSPMAIAQEIRQEMRDVRGNDYKVEVAAPGFLNFRMKDEYFVRQMLEIEQENFILWDEYSGRTIVTEFSDPNPFKVLHVGHLYTSIVGDAISRLLEFGGARVFRANFGGDVGLHVGKTLWMIMQKHYSPGDISIEEIAKCYVEGTKAYEEDETAKAEIVRLNKEIYRIVAIGKVQSEALPGEEGELARLYWRGRELSYEYFDEFYARIGVKFDKYYPESTVAERGLQEVKAHIDATYEESDGAIVYRGEKVGLHTRVFINREGVPTYETKDVGLLFTKWDDYHFDESVVITGNEQDDYMKVVLASVQEYAPELVERTSHLTHGMVRLPGNVKMSSRKGNFLKAVDVLEMVRDELGGEKADARVVLAAVKYAFLKYKMGGDIVFDPKESVATNGNSGVYLLYSVVRAKKILQKVKARDAQEMKEVGEYERKLMQKLTQSGDVLRTAAMDKAPYKVCGYLYELAQEFSRFYEYVPVAGSEKEGELAVLVRAYAKVMEQGLRLLGIEVPEEM